jgi:hypothetical protein
MGFAEGGLEWMQSQGRASSKRRSAKRVRWRTFLSALRAVGSDGFLTIEREVKTARRISACRPVLTTQSHPINFGICRKPL